MIFILQTPSITLIPTPCDLQYPIQIDNLFTLKLFIICVVPFQSFHSLSKICDYFNIVLIPTTRCIHMYYYKLYLLLIIHKVINLTIRRIHF